MPMKRSGRPVAAARVVTEIEDVFEARIASGRNSLSASRRTESFRSRRSGTAFNSEVGAGNLGEAVVAWMRVRIF